MISVGSVRLWTLDEIGAEIRIHVTPYDLPPRRPDVERRWAELTAENPRHFDGPILNVDDFDPATGVVHVHVDAYKHLAVQPQVDCGVILLAATGVITAHDARGRECVLMIRRHEQTRLYGGLWELGPAGGIDPTDASTLGLADVVSLVQKELEEEAGLDDALLEPKVACVYFDDDTASFDVVIRAHLARPVEALVASAGDTHWDASDVQWTPIDDLASFLTSHPCTPPTRVLAAAVGLIEPDQASGLRQS